MLNSLLPFNIQQFFSQVWNQKYFMWETNKGLGLDFGMADFKALIHSGDLCYPQISCLGQDGEVSPSEYLTQHPSSPLARVDSEKIMNLSRAGKTVRIRNLDALNPKIKILKDTLARELKSHLTVNIYYSRHSNGMKAHYDVHHVFAIQLSGEKLWKLGDRIKDPPRYDYTPIRIENDFVVREKIVLKAGNSLYIPRGLIHQTQTEEASLHLTIGVLPDDWTNYLEGLLKFVMKKHPVMRYQLPFICNEENLHLKKTSKDEIEQLLKLLLLEHENYSEQYLGEL